MDSPEASALAWEGTAAHNPVAGIHLAGAGAAVVEVGYRVRTGRSHTTAAASCRCGADPWREFRAVNGHQKWDREGSMADVYAVVKVGSAMAVAIWGGSRDDVARFLIGEQTRVYEPTSWALTITNRGTSDSHRTVKNLLEVLACSYDKLSYIHRRNQSQLQPHYIPPYSTRKRLHS